MRNSKELTNETQNILKFSRRNVELEAADPEALIEFSDDVAAVEYSVWRWLKQERTRNCSQLAELIGVNRAQLTKLRQGQISIPAGRFIKFITATRSLALLEFYATRLGLVVMKREEIESMKDEINRLQSDVDHYRQIAIGR